MSFMRTSALTRTIYAGHSQSSRTLSTSIIRNKSLTDSVKETADSINKKVGQTLAGGIEKGQQAANSAQATVASKTPSEAEVKSTASSASDKAAETAESAREKTNHALGTAAGKVRDATDELKK